MAKIIMGIKVDKRHEDAVKVQSLLTENGCIIKTRLGLHTAADDMSICSEDGLILLEFIKDAEDEIRILEAELSKLGGIHVQKMIF